MRFQLHHASMHLIFDFDEGCFGVGFAPLFHIAQHFCALAQPSFIIHTFFFLVSSFDRLILPAFLFPVHPSRKKVSHTRTGTLYRHNNRNVVYYLQGANNSHSFGRIIGIFSASTKQVQVRNARRETQ
jgi:hypothetical protein